MTAFPAAVSGPSGPGHAEREGLPAGGAQPDHRAVLLDTCVVLDLVIDPDQIAPEVRLTLADVTTELFVSAASAWEIAIKTRGGKLDGGERLLTAWDHAMADLRAESLPIDDADAIRAGGLSWAHRDPFDRILVSQAGRRNMPLATRDRVILDAGLVSVIDTHR